MNSFEFLMEALRNFKTVGTFTFSSKFLVDKMVEPIDFKAANTVLELGAGNGCITKGILSRMKSNARLFSFEINPSFCTAIQEDIQDKRLHLINDSAEKIDFYLKQAKVNKVDYIVSSLPLVNFSPELFENILEAAKHSLKPGGLFIQLSYFTTHLPKYKRHFSDVKVKFTPLNFPPGFVYVCRNPKVKTYVPIPEPAAIL